MSEQTKIQWADATFNPWRGCARVSPGCQHCYAETLSKRNPAVLGTWGVDGNRVSASESYWKQPDRWNARAEQGGRRYRVFCASLADWLEDRRDLDGLRYRLFDLIERTPAIDWLLLTKRPENFDKLARGSWVTKGCPSHVHLGVTAENQEYWNRRVRVLQNLPATWRFVSVEPCLSHIVFGNLTGIDQIIIGGESGFGARQMDADWARDMLAQAKRAGVAGFLKQLGTYPYDSALTESGASETLHLKDKKGGDPLEWTSDLRVRHFPEVRA